MRISLPSFKKTALTLALPFLMSQLSYANCEYQLFSISSAKGITIEEFVDQLSNECDYSIIITDPEAEKIVKKNLQKTTLKNLTISEVLDIVLIENNLNYVLENNVLKISYLITKTFQLDYLISKRTGKGSTDITLSSQTAASGGLNTTTANVTGSGSGNDSQTGITIETEDEVQFWHELDLEFERVLNRPADDYKADAPIINKNAGMVTVTATLKQMERLNEYIDYLQNKMQRQVLIDVHMLLVTFNDSKTTGVDWSQLFALQKFDLSGEYLSSRNVQTITDNDITEWGNKVNAAASFVKVASAGMTINQVIKFLKSQGDVSTVSNPKVLTLNNQPALITVGTEYFYKVKQSANQQGTSGGVASTVQTDIVSSVFAGVLLDITPEIANDDTITLKINPSVSRTREDLAAQDAGGRTIPPDLDRRQLASVVTVKDGEQVILGGLINQNNGMTKNKVPLLGDIPGLGYLFSYEAETLSTEELIVVIEPHIIKKEKNSLSLSELGYERIDPKIASTTHMQDSNGSNGK
jgi:general secretion pathway protein D